MHAHCSAQADLSLSLVHTIVILMFHACVEWSLLRPLHSLHLLSLHLSYLLALAAALHPTSLMSWITSPRTSAEELGTLAEKNSSTGYEPNDHFITEAYVEFTQESSSKQRFPEDFDYDDITIGQTLLNTCRRRADRHFFQTKGRVSCPRELRKVRLKKARQWRNRDQWLWCQGTSWAQSM